MADAMASLATEVDIVVNGVVGFAGLSVALATLEAGRRLALANKESLIAAGPLVQRAARWPQAGGQWDSCHGGPQPQRNESDEAESHVTGAVALLRAAVARPLARSGRCCRVGDCSADWSPRGCAVPSE
jgi:hypothetical protein